MLVVGGKWWFGGRILDVDVHLGDPRTHGGHHDEQSSPSVPPA